jgi:hypothetical protein
MSDDTGPDHARTDAESGSGDTAARVRRGLDYALLGGLVLLGLVAAIQFYFAADRTINVWVTREYRPPFKMLFNLVVLLVVGIGLSRQVRRLTDGDDADSADPSTDATTDGGSDRASKTTTEPSDRASETPAERRDDHTDSRERADDTD